jgi:cell wall-associated NlpC family hydrolase
MRIPEYTERYLSIPYGSCDCWGLVQKVYAAEFGIDVGPVEDQRDHLRAREWVDVIHDGLAVKEGDVVLFKSSAVNRHVAIILNHELMLHTFRGGNSCVERWKSPLWERRLMSIYRHVSQCPT